MAATPLILPSSEGPGRPLRRLDIQPGSGMDEAWLQALIVDDRLKVKKTGHLAG